MLIKNITFWRPADETEKLFCYPFLIDEHKN